MIRIQYQRTCWSFVVSGYCWWIIFSSSMEAVPVRSFGPLINWLQRTVGPLVYDWTLSTRRSYTQHDVRSAAWLSLNFPVIHTDCCHQYAIVGNRHMRHPCCRHSFMTLTWLSFYRRHRFISVTKVLMSSLKVVWTILGNTRLFPIASFYSHVQSLCTIWDRRLSESTVLLWIRSGSNKDDKTVLWVTSTFSGGSPSESCRHLYRPCFIAVDQQDRTCSRVSGFPHKLHIG